MQKQTLSLFKKSETHLFFDTETTGLPLNNMWQAPAENTVVWPRVVQLAWEYYKDGQLENSGNYIIKPEGFSIPSDSARVHGITTERARAEGVVLSKVLEEFSSLVKGSDFIVAHNVSFDEKVMGAEFIRAGMGNLLAGKQTVCTKELSTNFCAIPHPARSGYKWPTLAELHGKLFGTGFDEAHNAMADVKATAKCFWELKKQGVA